MQFIYLFIYFFLSLIAPYSIFYKSSFTLKLDFEKIELQKMGIFQISLGNGAKGCIICAKRALAQIPLNYCICCRFVRSQFSLCMPIL